MGNRIKSGIFLIVFFVFSGLFAQNQVGINQTSIDPSSVLDIFSINKGLLIPRMSSTERRSLESPSNGLLIFETTANTFWYYSNAEWSELIADNNGQDGIGDADTDTRVFLEFTSDNDNIRFYQGGTEYFRMIRKRFDVRNIGNSVFLGDSAGYNDDKVSGQNVYIGNSSGSSAVNSIRNVAVGYQAVMNNLNETDNLVIGAYAFKNATAVRRNVAIGSSVLSSSISSENHTVIGHSVMENHTSGDYMVALGIGSLKNDINCGSNTAVGNKTFANSTTNGVSVALGVGAGSVSNVNFNVYVGFNAGAQNNTARRLFIDNSNTNTPLLFGDFGNDILTVNDNLFVSDDLYYVGSLTDVSDKRLKKKIRKIEPSLNKLKGLNSYKYHLKDKPNKEKQYGLIAQEVKTVYPSLTSIIYPENGYMGVSYIQFIPLILEAEKEQYLQLEELNSTLKTQEVELNELENDIALIKAKLAAQALNR